MNPALHSSELMSSVQFTAKSFPLSCLSALRMQIPAFLCRQTDLIVAAAKTGAIIQIKKGQFCAASVMRNSAEKCRAAGKCCCYILAYSIDDPVECFCVVVIRITKPSQANSDQTSAAGFHTTSTSLTVL